MNAEVADYWRAVDGFLHNVRSLDGELVGLLLHGSLVEGTVRPGQSDLLDAFLVVRQSSMRNRERYLRLLEVVVTASAAVAASGLPFHPACWYGEEELGSVTSENVFQPTIVAKTYSTILAGEDFRPKLAGGTAAGPLTQALFFEARQRLWMPLAALIARPELSPRDRQWLRARLKRIHVVLAVIACATLGVRLEKAQARATLESVLPGVDLKVLDEIGASVRDGSLTRLGDSGLRDLARRALETAEALHDRIAAQRRDP